MLADLKLQLTTVIEEALQEFINSLQIPIQSLSSPSIVLEIPSDKKFGEYSCNLALRCANLFKKNPFELANSICDLLRKKISQGPLKTKVIKIEVVKPGFINFYLTSEAVFEILEEILLKENTFGKSELQKNKKVQIEFVSANPTGPLSVAHARQAVVGDALGNILIFLGYEVYKEYYVNDEGNQINILGRSIQLRAQELLGESISFPEDCYQGEYIKDMSQIFISQRHISDLEGLKRLELGEFSKFGVDYLLAIIKKELDDFGLQFNVWSYQSQIATLKSIENVLLLLRQKGFIYDQEGAVWFKSTVLGDDKDRVVKKSDGSFTYLTPDIVYHQNKFERGFDQVINIWGPDHHGYIPRLKAAVDALGYNPNDLEVLIVQLATIYRDGKPLSMSTRKGQYISLREVLNEVGKDAARFFFLMRHIKAHLEFDLELAKKETSENPVYYIQYAHARIHSVLHVAMDSKLTAQSSHFKLLKEPEEIELIKKLGIFPDVLTICQKQLDPYLLTAYLQDVATVFHQFYDKHRVVDDNNSLLSGERLALINATRIVLMNGLTLLGVSAPQRM